MTHYSNPMWSYRIIYLWLVVQCMLVSSEFVINAKNDDNNVVRVVIQEYSEDSYLTLEYIDWDLTKITQLVDIKSGFTIYRAILYGELDLGQPPIETLCFVNHIAPTDFIEPDSVSKLRQKNQDAIRRGETNLGLLTSEIDLIVNYDLSERISSHIKTFCKAARSNGAIYTTSGDLSKTAQVYSRSLSRMLEVTRKVESQALRCTNSAKSCQCYYRLSVSWYPCSLKYCKSPDSPNDMPAYYKCGINTCSLSRLYMFPVDSRSRCWWETFHPVSSD